jgi:hypothetical protein
MRKDKEICRQFLHVKCLKSVHVRKTCAFILITKDLGNRLPTPNGVLVK